ncbi:MAG: hypothetical protein O3A25_11245 [Acidobacteria bacterium]|nr:hypothetical protein [Acidobacteriota bacterium]
MANSRVALLAVGTLIGAWLSSASSTAPPASAGPQAGLVATVPLAAESRLRLDLDHEVSRLTARLETAPRPHSPGRNPFRSGRAEVAPGTSASESLMPEIIADAPPAVAGWASAGAPPEVAGWASEQAPSITLAGVGAERTPTGLRHTAILSSNGRVFLSHVGDQVMGRYQVRSVTSDAAHLLDQETGQSLRLTLP